VTSGGNNFENFPGNQATKFLVFIG